MRKSMNYQILIIAYLLATLGVSCGRGSKSHFESIPQSSLLWVTADLEAVRSDRVLMDALSVDEITTELESLGLSPDAASRLTVFGIYQSGTFSDGALVTGRLNAKQVVKRLSEAGWEGESYEKDKLYRNPQQTEVYIAVLYNDTVLFGSKEACFRKQLTLRGGEGWKIGRMEGWPPPFFHSSISKCKVIFGEI